MIGASPLEAYERVLSRAHDLRNVFRSGALSLNDDVRTAPEIVPSSDPLSVVPPPGAWLVTRSADGTRAFERDGALTFVDGALRTASGSDVLGYPDGDAGSAVPTPLRMSANDAALGRTADARVEPDGSVVYTRTAIDPHSGARTAERVTLGKLALARFPAGTRPQRIDASRATAPRGVVPHLGTAGDGTFAPLATFSRDAGSIDIAAGVERLDEAYRAFEALGAAMRSRAGVDKTAVDLVK